MEQNSTNEMHEKNVIASIILKPELFSEVANKLTFEDFTNRDYAHIFTICQNIFDEYGELSPTRLMEEISYHNLNEKVINIIEGTYDYIEFTYSVQRMKEESKKRKLLSVNQELEKLLNSNEFEISEIERLYQKTLENVEEIEEDEDDLIEKVMDTIFERKRKRDNNEPLIEIDTGYSELNLLTNGFHRGDLVILAARPGMGKTAFMLNMVEKQLRQKNKVMIFSLEMSKELLIERLVSIISGVSLQKIRWGYLSDDDLGDIVEALDFLKENEENLIIRDKSDVKINEIKAEIRKEQKRKNIDVVYVDYLQLINSGSAYNNKNIEVGEVSRISKVMARELNVAVVMLAQLSREVEKRAEKRPVLSDLRDSGEIEQNADLVLFLYREAYYKGNGDKNINEEIEVILSKHRNGPLGTIKVAFLKDNLEFREVKDNSKGGTKNGEEL